MRYNHFRVGAWCSGSTWASDSHGVGSIPIAPANALHPREKRGCIFMPARLGLPKRGRGIKITPRKRCKALNPRKEPTEAPAGGITMAPAPPSRIRILSFSHFTARLGLPKRGLGIKITPRKRCKALNPPKGADGSPRRGYYYGSCPSEPNPHFKFFPLYRPSRLAEARTGIKITPRKRCKALNPRKEPTEAPAGGITMAPALNRVFAFCSPAVPPPAAGVD